MSFEETVWVTTAGNLRFRTVFSGNVAKKGHRGFLFSHSGKAQSLDLVPMADTGAKLQSREYKYPVCINVQYGRAFIQP